MSQDWESRLRRGEARSIALLVVVQAVGLVGHTQAAQDYVSDGGGAGGHLRTRPAKLKTSRAAAAPLRVSDHVCSSSGASGSRNGIEASRSRRSESRASYTSSGSSARVEPIPAGVSPAPSGSTRAPPKAIARRTCHSCAPSRDGHARDLGSRRGSAAASRSTSATSRAGSPGSKEEASSTAGGP
jgi:hypothetical protein